VRERRRAHGERVKGVEKVLRKSPYDKLTLSPGVSCVDKEGILNYNT
jgi:hypothetical protein